jgi:hypothetical protein
MLHAHLPPPVGEVRALRPTRAWGAVPNLFVRGLSALLPAIALETRRLARGARGRQPQTGGSGGGTEARECRHAIGVERSEGTSEGVLMARAGVQAWGQKARERLRLEKRGDEGQRLVHEAQAGAAHGLDRMAGGHKPHARGLVGGVSHDRRDAAFFTQPCDSTQGSHALRTVRLWRWREVRAV